MKQKNPRRGTFIVSIGLAAFLLLLLSPGQLHAEKIKYKGKTYDIALPGDYIPKQLVVVEKKEKKARKDVYNLANELGANILHEHDGARMYLFEFIDDKSVEKALKKIAKKKNPPFVAFRNWRNSIPRPPIKAKEKTASKKSNRTNIQHWTNDPAFRSQWWLWKIKEPWSGTPYSGKNIAIIDTGVDYNHADLTGKVEKGFDYVDWDWDPMDENGHGTHCAGIAAAYANNNIGIHGVSPGSKIWAYRCFNRYGSGGSYQIMAAITDAADNPNVHVISCSFGGYYQYGSSGYLTYRDVIDYARITKKKIVCCAAGNEYNSTIYYYFYYGSYYYPCPAHFPNSYTVGATQIEDRRTAFTNSDVNNLPSGDGSINYNWDFIDIVGPGEDILSTLPGDQYGLMSGTSMSTPLVAGCAARVWAKNPGWLPFQVQSQLINTGTPVHRIQGFHRREYRVDLMKALGGSVTGLQGQVIDGEKGFPVCGAKVEVKTGGVLAKTVYTNKAGIWTATGLSPSSVYTILVSKPAYVTEWGWVGAPGTSGIIRDVNMPLPMLPSRPTSGGDENWRIVVYWPSLSPGYDDYYYRSYASSYWPYETTESPGMEANGYLQTPSATYYYGNMGALGAPPYAKFMHDSYFYTSSPLESFVVQDQETGVYKFWLNTDVSDHCWGQMQYAARPSPSICKVYKGNTLMQTINCRDATRISGGTKYWYAFDLSGNVVTVVNQITDTWPGT